MRLEELKVGTKLEFKEAGNELLHCVQIQEKSEEKIYVLRINGSNYVIENENPIAVQTLLDTCEVLTDEEYETKIRAFWKDHEHPEGQLEFLDETKSGDTEA